MNEEQTQQIIKKLDYLIETMESMKKIQDAHGLKLYHINKQTELMTRQ